MKNSTLRGLFAAALVLVSSSAFAQVGSLTASASAVIVQPVNITKDTDLNFGTLAGGFVKTVSTIGAPSGTATASGDESAAQFEVTKGANVPVKLDVTGLVLLNGTTELPAIFEVEAISTANGSAAVPFLGADADNDRTLQIAGGGLTNNAIAPVTSLTGTTALKVRIGGTVSPITSQTPGTYTGTITLTAVYN